MTFKLYAIIAFAALISIGAAMQLCFNNLQHRQYFKIKKCKRSDAGLLSRNNFETVKECMKYAREKNALAFNYSPADAKREKGDGEYFYNCQILSCAEGNNFTTLVNDTSYDYYSSYGNNTDLTNSTCIKSIGMFRIFDKKENYTTAIENCQNVGGDLAHILTETRTTMIASLLGQLTDWYKAAYIGLEDRNREGWFETPLGDPISCYRYRAWAPGQPRNIIKSDDCVIIDRDRTWRVVNCKNKLPYICELYPKAPKLIKKYVDVDCDDLETSAERNECETVQRNRRNNRRRKNRCFDD